MLAHGGEWVSELDARRSRLRLCREVAFCSMAFRVIDQMG
jgi:hypothetical protein